MRSLFSVAEGRRSINCRTGPLSVLVKRCLPGDATYLDPDALDAALQRLLAPLIGTISRGAVVLVKPNLVTAEKLACTDARLVETVCRHLLDAGFRVRAGDSPAFGTALSVARAIGLAERLDRLGVKLDPFSRIRRVRLASGPTLPVAAAALECDLLLNLPRLKAHAQMRVTACVKNLFGCVSGLRKACLHFQLGDKGRRFDDVFLDLLDVLPAHVHLVDAITVMHGTGPVRGFALHPGLLFAGNNAVAVDTAICTMLELRPEEVSLWSAAAARNICGASFAELDFPLDRPEEDALRDFVTPEVLDPQRFQPLRMASSLVRRTCLRLRPDMLKSRSRRRNSSRT